ncbi:MAG: cation transporter [Paludibacteraceae bacterium]|nr:cation transporter [Paludibacteraceae bacterium]
MKKIIAILLLALLAGGVAGAAEPQLKVVTTFLVMMNGSQSKKEISKALKEQPGIKKVEFDLEAQTVVVTFDGRENTVSNLLKVFKKSGHTAAAMETGCFGDPNGCINAMKPDNIMP